MSRIWTRRAIFALILCLAAASPGVAADTRPRTPTQPGTPTEFLNRVAQYAKLRNALQEKLPTLKDRDTPVKIERHERALADSIQKARAGAKQGDVFAPATRPFFMGLAKAEIGGARNTETRATIKQGNPRFESEHDVKHAPVQIAVNALYPKDAPLSSVPASLLSKLPKLPEELEYRFVGRTLILLDTTANLIVDYLPEVSPSL